VVGLAAISWAAVMLRCVWAGLRLDWPSFGLGCC